ncbi:MAG TPA: sigma-70 family RNA polymerase sigma factor [Gemmatimonadaceae bacterium]|nr:sigma-70 family RNA polymerase sigma factor [Gemmatimonadaceae bacterium]
MALIRQIPYHRAVSADQPVDTVGRFLDDARRGDPTALEQLLPIVYTELHRIAGRHLQRERPGHTLQPTALVHEAYLRLVGGTVLAATNRVHFLRAASRAMRQALVDHARARNAQKRGGALQVTLDEAIAGEEAPMLDMLALDDALTRLAAAEPRWAQVVELKFFGGLEVLDIAESLGVSPATVKRDWQFARAWLSRELAT